MRNAVFLALCLVATRTRNLKFHRLFAGGALVYEVITSAANISACFNPASRHQAAKQAATGALSEARSV